MSFTLRPCTAERHGELLTLFKASVHSLTGLAYDANQRAAWAPPDMTVQEFSQRIASHQVWVAEAGSALIGFATLAGDGWFGLLYVHPHFVRQGVGGALIEVIERDAQAQGRHYISADASLIAAPLFRRHGWQGHARRSVIRDGVALENIRMEKALA